MYSSWSVASKLWKSSFTASGWVQTQKHPPAAAFNREGLWRLACSSPQAPGSPHWMTSLSRWSMYHLSPQRGGVELKKLGGSVHSKQWSLSGTDAPWLLLCSCRSSAVIGRAGSWLFLSEHRKSSPKVRKRRERPVTEVSSWGTGWGTAGGGLEAGRSVPGCGCSQGGRSGSGGPRGKSGRGSSDALWGGEEQH